MARSRPRSPRRRVPESGHFRRLMPALELARSVSVRLQQLAMCERLPSNAFLVWDVRGVGPDTFHHSRRLTVVGFRSQGPLLGAASFHLRLPDCATGLYLGVRQWQGHLRSYCRIDNLFRRGSRWAVGLNDALPMPHSGRERFQILPGEPLRLAMERKVVRCGPERLGRDPCQNH